MRRVYDDAAPEALIVVWETVGPDLQQTVATADNDPGRGDGDTDVSASPQGVGGEAALRMLVGTQPVDPSLTDSGNDGINQPVRLRTGRPVSQYAGSEGCTGLAGAEPHALGTGRPVLRRSCGLVGQQYPMDLPLPLDDAQCVAHNSTGSTTTNNSH